MFGELALDGRVARLHTRTDECVRPYVGTYLIVTSFSTRSE